MISLNISWKEDYMEGSNYINKLRIMALAFLAILFFVSQAWSATYYVRTDGNDSNDGSVNDAGHAWLTIQHAADTMTAGDTVQVQAGTYGGNSVRIITKANGSSGNLITFQANGTCQTVGFDIRHDYIKVDGFKLRGFWNSYDGAIHLTGAADHCIVSNNDIYVNEAYDAVGGIYLDGGSYNTFSDNIVDNCEYPAIVIWGHHHLFEDNVLRHLDHDAVRVWGHDHTFRGNEIHHVYEVGGNHPDLFQSFCPADQDFTCYNILIEKNYFHDTDSQICSLSDQSASHDRIHDITFRNNLFVNIKLNSQIYVPNVNWYNNTFYHVCQISGNAISYKSSPDYGTGSGVLKNNIFIYCGSANNYSPYSGGTADYNYCAWEPPRYASSSGFSETHGINGGDPKFSNAGGSNAENYKIGSDSPAKNKATTISGFNDDYFGTSRLQNSWDIGACESSGFTSDYTNDESTISPPTEDTISPPTEDTISPPTEDTLSPPTEDTLSPPTGFKIVN